MNLTEKIKNANKLMRLILNKSITKKEVSNYCEENKEKGILKKIFKHIFMYKDSLPKVMAKGSAKSFSRLNSITLILFLINIVSFNLFSEPNLFLAIILITFACFLLSSILSSVIIFATTYFFHIINRLYFRKIKRKEIKELKEDLLNGKNKEILEQLLMKNTLNMVELKECMTFIKEYLSENLIISKLKIINERYGKDLDISNSFIVYELLRSLTKDWEFENKIEIEKNKEKENREKINLIMR